MLEKQQVRCENNKQISFQHMQQTGTPPLKEALLR
jgi:hypothetical protein